MAEMLAGRISGCRVCNTTPAAIPIFGKCCSAVHCRCICISFITCLQPGLGLMGWRCVLCCCCCCFHGLKVRFPGAQQSWSRGQSNDTVPSLSCSDPAAHLHHVLVAPWGTQREVLGLFLPLLCVFSKWKFHCHASGLTGAVQFPNA